MSSTQLNQRIGTTPSAAVPGSTRRGSVRSYSALALVSLILLAAVRAHAAENVDLVSDGSGITLTAAGNNYTASLGTMNGIGAGTPAGNVNVIQLGTGALYYTFYDVSMASVTGAHTAYLTAYVSSNFGQSAALVLESCPYPSACTGSGNYSPMSTSAAAQTDIIPSPGLPQGSLKRVGLAIYLPDNDGGSAYTGSSALTTNVTITFTATDFNTGKKIKSFTLTLNNNTVQDAVQLTLAHVTGGLAVTSASDYSMNFQNVNALGIAPIGGLTTSAPTSGGGMIYSTPYQIVPAFSDFAHTTATVTFCLTSSFTNSTFLVPQDSATGAVGSFSAILDCTHPVTVSSTATDRTAITRYIGVLVTNGNGSSIVYTSQNATLTYTMTVN